MPKTWNDFLKEENKDEGITMPKQDWRFWKSRTADKIDRTGHEFTSEDLARYNPIDKSVLKRLLRPSEGELSRFLSRDLKNLFNSRDAEKRRLEEIDRRATEVLCKEREWSGDLCACFPYSAEDERGVFFVTTKGVAYIHPKNKGSGGSGIMYAASRTGLAPVIAGALAATGSLIGNALSNVALSDAQRIIIARAGKFPVSFVAKCWQGLFIPYGNINVLVYSRSENRIYIVFGNTKEKMMRVSSSDLATMLQVFGTPDGPRPVEKVQPAAA